MIIKNAKYLDENFLEKTGDIEIEDGRIKAVADAIPYTDKDFVVDCQGFTVVPGFVDVHTHGAVGCDCSDGEKEGVLAIAKFLISKGVTTFCPTTMTMPTEEIRTALISIREAKAEQTGGAYIAGVNLEGPFISGKKKGAQSGDSIIAPSFELFKEFFEISGNNIKLVDIAPEVEGGEAFIQKAKELVTVSIAHTTATYDQTVKCFAAGVTHATHMYNAMPGLAHRAPGVVGAIMDTDSVRAELVCDGHHIHPAVVRSTFKIMGDRLMIISDAMRLSGMEEGEDGSLGGQMVTVKDGVATLSDGTIASSISNLHDELKNLVSWGVPFSAAVKAMTLTPATAIGMENEIGSIQAGKKADLVVLDSELNIAAVYHE